MPIISIAESLSKKVFDTREALEAAVVENLLEECPFLAEANASTLRNMVSIILNYNRVADNYGRPYRPLIAAHGLTGAASVNSTFTFDFSGGKLTVLAAANEHILKVCPKCKLTACIGDPVCPGCNHSYAGYELEEAAITAACAALGVIGELASASSITEAASITASNTVILDDAVEGFKVTEGDVDRQMKDVHKYMPGSAQRK